MTLNRKILHSARNLAEPIRLMNSLKYMIGFDGCQTVRKKIDEVAAEMTYTRLFKLFSSSLSCTNLSVSRKQCRQRKLDLLTPAYN